MISKNCSPHNGIPSAMHHGSTALCYWRRLHDRASPPALIPDFLAAFKGPTYLATVPNGQHSPGTRMQTETFRMWVDHILFDRPLGQLSINKLSYNKGALHCEVQVKGSRSQRSKPGLCSD